MSETLDGVRTPCHSVPMTTLTIRADVRTRTGAGAWQAHRPDCQHLNLAGYQGTFDIEVSKVTEEAIDAELAELGYEDTALVISPCAVE